MRNKLALLAMRAALSSWSLAQTTNPPAQDRDDKQQNAAHVDRDADNKGDADIDVVSGPSVDAASDHAMIHWKTDKVSSSLIKYGTDRNNMSQEQKVAGGSRDHDVTLTGLQPGTKYFFEIVSRKGE